MIHSGHAHRRRVSRVCLPAMSDGAPPEIPVTDPPSDPALTAALDKAEKYKQKLHGAVKKGKSIETERDALKSQLDTATKDLATANTKLKVMREMEAAAAAAESSSSSARVAELEQDLNETRAQLEHSEEELRKAKQDAARSEAERERVSKALDDLRAMSKGSRRGEADNIVAAARAEDAERRAGEIAAELAAQRVARAAAEDAATAAHLAAEEAHIELASLGDGARAERLGAENARREADTERRAAADARDAAEASAARAEERAANAEERAADAEAELERLAEESEVRRARFEHVQQAHAERESKLRKQLEQALLSGTRPTTSISQSTNLSPDVHEKLALAERKIDTLRRELCEASESNLAGQSSEYSVDMDSSGSITQESYDTLLRKLAVAETAAAMHREELGEVRQKMAEEFKTERREFNSKLERLEQEKVQTRRALEDALDETARVRAMVGSGSGSNNSGNDKALAAANATAARLAATVESLEIENKSLQWQVAIGGSTGTPLKRMSDMEQGTVQSSVGIESGNHPPLVERILKNKSHRRTVVISYLVVLHLLVYFSTTHGAFTHGSSVKCVSPVR